MEPVDVDIETGRRGETGGSERRGDEPSQEFLGVRGGEGVGGEELGCRDEEEYRGDAATDGEEGYGREGFFPRECVGGWEGCVAVVVVVVRGD